MDETGTGKLYRIVVRSEVSDRYAAAFEGMQIEAKVRRSSPGRS